MDLVNNILPGDAKNEGMNPWKRIDDELRTRRLTWQQLGNALDSSKQAVSNWRKNGVPAKFYSAIDRFFNMPSGWTETGDSELKQLPPMVSKDKLNVVLVTIASGFRSIPEDKWGDVLLEVSEVLSRHLPNLPRK